MFSFLDDIIAGHSFSSCQKLARALVAEYRALAAADSTRRHVLRIAHQLHVLESRQDALITAEKRDIHKKLNSIECRQLQVIQEAAVTAALNAEEKGIIDREISYGSIRISNITGLPRVLEPGHCDDYMQSEMAKNARDALLQCAECKGAGCISKLEKTLKSRQTFWKETLEEEMDLWTKQTKNVWEYQEAKHAAYEQAIHSLSAGFEGLDLQSFILHRCFVRVGKKGSPCIWQASKCIFDIQTIVVYIECWLLHHAPTKTAYQWGREVLRAWGGFPLSTQWITIRELRTSIENNYCWGKELWVEATQPPLRGLLLLRASGSL